MLKKPRSSVAASLAPAIVVFPFVCGIAFVIVRSLLLELIDNIDYDNIQNVYLIDKIVIGFLIGLPLLFAYPVSRIVYTKMRWQTIEDENNRYCDHCDYDLRGNESGICSECGSEVDKNK